MDEIEYTWHYVISEECNMNCTYCNVDVKNKKKLTSREFDSFYETMISECEMKYKFDIFGGEPLLQLDEVEYIIQKLEKDKNCKTISITTNGTVFNDRVVSIINNPLVSVILSHDGHNQSVNRGKLKVYTKELKEAGVFVAHSMLVGKDFDYALENMIIKNHQILESLGFSPDLALVRDVGTWSPSQVKIFQGHYIQYIDKLIVDLTNNKYNEFKQIPGLVKLYLSAFLEFVINGNVKPDCGVGTTYTAITPGLKISPCERFLRDNVKLTDRVNLLSKCDTCDIRDFCDRGCIYEQLKNGEPISELCDIYHIIFKEIQRLIKETGVITIKLFKK